MLLAVLFLQILCLEKCYCTGLFLDTIWKGFDHIAALGVGPEIQFHVVCRMILKIEDSTSSLAVFLQGHGGILA